MLRDLFVVTIIRMHITYDPKNDANNFVKYGVSLAKAALLEWEGACEVHYEDAEHGERTEIVIAYIGLRLYVMRYLPTEGGLHVLNLRRATSEEVAQYAKA